MSERKRLGILFNETQDAVLLLDGVRRIHPEAYLVAIVSPHAAFPEDNPADEVLRVELSPLRLLLAGASFKMIKELRAQRFDLFIIRFSTLKLRILAALVASKKCEIWQSNGTIFPAAASFSATVRQYFAGRLSGMMTVGRAWRSACFSIIRPKNTPSKDGARQ